MQPVIRARTALTRTAIDSASSALRRVVLITGTKYYGSHLGPFKTPARESDPRHMGPNYYFDQIDWLAASQRGKRWDWVELRPQTLCGFAPGTRIALNKQRRELRAQAGILLETLRDTGAVFLNTVAPTPTTIVRLIPPF